MKTFRADLIRLAFKGECPPFSNSKNVEIYFKEKNNNFWMFRAYEIGKLYRKSRDLSEEHKKELEYLSREEGFFDKVTEEDRKYNEIMKAFSKSMKPTTRILYKLD